MQAQENGSVGLWTLIDIMHAQALIAGQVIDLVWGVVPAIETLEAVFRRAHRFNGHEFLLSEVFVWFE